MINDRKVDRVGDAINQMQKIIERYITNSLKGDLFEKALECFNELRTACIREDEAENFNAFAAHVKQQFDRGNRKESFFQRIRDSGTSLITKAETFSSTMDKNDADDFIRVEKSKAEDSPIKMVDHDSDID